MYLRRDNTGATTGLYTKTSGSTIAIGWEPVGTTDAVAPTGVIQAFGGETAPTGWLLCDGAAHSRTVYSDLFEILGVRFGSGDGSTTFNLPDYRGRVAVGYAASGGHPDVSTLGNDDGQASANRRPKHRTTNSLGIANTMAISGNLRARESINSGSSDFASGGFDTNPINLQGSVSITGSIGTNNGNDALDTPSYIVVNHIIKT